MVVQAPFRFELPDELSAHEPPEKRGLTRDGVRLLAADRRTGTLAHTRFNRIADFLAPGDCLVLNASRTLPAVLPALIESAGADRAESAGAARAEAGQRLQLRLARRWEDGAWSVLALANDETPFRGHLAGARLILASGGPQGADLSAEILERDPFIDRLWKIRFSRNGQGLMEALSRLGHPVRYWYASAPWDLDYYQTVYAREPGSVEMPSAGRAFTWRLLLDLRRKGVDIAFLVLHASLSSYMDGEFDSGHPASVESFHLEAGAADRINAAKAKGGRVIAVGTTVVRALESAADASGRVHARTGSTRLRITPEYRLRVADGLLTGFHEPTASHLDLLSAFMPPDRLHSVYEAALREKYLWHEFGDANLIL